MSKRPVWTQLPRCDACGLAQVITAERHPRFGEFDGSLICAACGEVQKTDPERHAQAETEEFGSRSG